MYYLIELTTYVDDTKDAQGLYTYTNLNDATASFHQRMAGAIRNDNYASELCQIIDEQGQVKRSERWERAIEQE